MPLKYLSLFSGIGGFEIAIHNIFPDAICIGYSEVDKYAVKVYQHHFPTHSNLGDITKITEFQIKKVVEEYGGCDLVVGGFPCKSLSSLSSISSNNTGLNGKSKLFYDLLRVCTYVQTLCEDVNYIFENNSSMPNKYKQIITNVLHDNLNIYHCTLLNNADFGVQTRRRLFWTSFYVQEYKGKCIQEWKDVLSPVEVCTHYVPDKCVLRRKADSIRDNVSKTFDVMKDECSNLWTFKISISNRRTIWQKSYHSDMGKKEDIHYTYPIGKSRCITTGLDIANYIIDRRFSTDQTKFKIRHFTDSEKEKLFFLPDKWITQMKFSRSRNSILLGNSVSVKVVEYILKCLVLSCLFEFK